MLRLITFGGLRILLNDEPVTGLVSRKAEALLVYLAGTSRPLPRELLADLLWDNRSQKRAMSYLRVVLSSLRKQLSPFLAITRHTAAFNPDANIWYDAAELENVLVEERLHAGPAASPAVDRMASAVALYQGDFLAGFHIRQAKGFEEWVTVERERLRQLALDGLGALVAYHVQGAEVPAAIRHARHLLRLDPLREPAHRQMMKLLAYSGRGSEALGHYETCRQLLWDELGVEPSAETQALHQAIVAGEVVEMAGAHRDRLVDGSPLSSTADPRVSRDLPAQPTPFTGREEETAALGDMLQQEDGRLVTIVGAGGMGKTRLAIEVAARHKERFADGVCFVSLAPVDTPDRIPLVLAERLGLLFYGGSAPADQILDYLGSQHVLLIFDNFEHLVTRAEFIAAILQRAPNVTVLVTSRERLLIAGEAVLSLGSLSFPDNPETELTDPDQAAADYSAIGLFLYHARLVRPDLPSDPAALVEVARICRLVQGMPLAIILAASWIETLSPGELGDAIADSVDILASEQRDLPPRQRSIRATFEASWTRLAPSDRAVFARLSVFRGGFTRKSAEVVAGANLFTLRTLIEKSLITPGSLDRYELHELLRQFAGEKLAESGELDGVRKAHGQHYLGALRNLEADVKGQRQVEAFKEIEADLDNIQHAWYLALAQAWFPLVDETLETLTLFCHYNTRPNEAHELFQAAREKLEGGIDRRLLGRLLARHAWLKSEYGLETDSIQTDLDRSWAIAEQLDDEREMAHVLLARGWYATRIHDDLAAGLAAFEQAYHLCQALDDRFYMAILLGRIGFCQTDPASYAAYTRQSLALALETGNEHEPAWAQFNLGAYYLHSGDSVAGEELLRHSLNARIKDTSARNLLALAGFLRGDLEQMERLLPPQELMVIGKMNPQTIAYVSATRALLAVVNGDLENAEQLAHRGLEFPSNPNPVLLAHWALALVYLARGNLAEARQRLSVVYRLPRITGYPGIMTRSLPVAALILARSDQPERAAQILSLALNHPASQTGWLRHWASGATLRAELEVTLGAVAFQNAWEHGKGLDLAKTFVHLASELSGEVMVSATRHSLPSRPTSFVGRESELADIADRLADPACRLLTLVGTGGIGKTRLAIEAAAGQVEHYAHGVVFVGLEAVDPADFAETIDPVLATLADALNIPLQGGTDPKQQLIRYLAGKKMLLLCDNFEHLLASTTIVADLLRGAPRVKLMVTSRERLNLQEEWLCPVDGMTFPESAGQAPQLRERYSAVQLFEQRARQVQTAFDPIAEYPGVVRICQLVEGMPLGIELAAAWVRMMSCREIAREIERRLDFLSTSLADVPERHRSLRAVFEQSWRHLSDAERTAFTRLSVFRGGFTRVAAESVTGASLLLLSTLVDKSLLRADPSGRYTIHERLRQFAAEKLENGPGEYEQVRDRHCRFYLNFLAEREAHLKGQKFKEGMAAIDADIDNVRAAWRSAIKHQMWAELRGAMECLGLFFSSVGWFIEGEDAFGQVVSKLSSQREQLTSAEMKPSLPDARLTLGVALAHQGSFHSYLAHHEKAKASGQKSIALLLTAGHSVRREVAFSKALLGISVMYLEEKVQAQHLLQESLTLLDEAKDQWGSGYVLSKLGQLGNMLGEYTEAERFLQQSLDLFRTIGEQRHITYTISYLGRVALSQGRLTDAESFHKECLQRRRELGDRPGMGLALGDLGDVFRFRGDLTQAEQHYRQSQAIAEETGDYTQVAVNLWGLSSLAEMRGEYAEARKLILESKRLFQTYVSDLFLGWIALGSGDHQAAEQYFIGVLKLATDARWPRVILHALAGLAAIRAKAGDTERAMELVSLVLGHASVHQEFKGRAIELRKQLVAELSPATVHPAAGRGRVLDLWQTASQLIDELS